MANPGRVGTLGLEIAINPGEKSGFGDWSLDYGDGDFVFKCISSLRKHYALYVASVLIICGMIHSLELRVVLL
jgi:hypothetical protein